MLWAAHRPGSSLQFAAEGQHACLIDFRRMNSTTQHTQSRTSTTSEKPNPILLSLRESFNCTGTLLTAPGHFPTSARMPLEAGGFQPVTEVFLKEWSELVLREAPRRIGSEQLEAPSNQGNQCFRQCMLLDKASAAAFVVQVLINKAQRQVRAPSETDRLTSRSWHCGQNRHASGHFELKI